jgi:signal transduction histidine kinase
VPDLFQEEKAIILEGPHIHSEIIAPILVGNQVKVVINIGKAEVNSFSDHDLWTLSSLAGQAAIVMENAQLYQHIDGYSEKLERIIAARTQRLQAITKISQIVSQGLAVDQLLEVVGESINQIFAPETREYYIKVTVGLINGSRLIVQTIYDVSQAEQDPLLEAVTVYKVDYRTIVGQVIDQSKPVILSNVDSQNIYYTSSNSEQVLNSLMIAPLITGGKTIGIILVESRTLGAFDESDLETLESLAFQVASAIENARLLQKSRELAIVDERTRLARDMHDGVAQNLAYLLIQVDRCLNMVEEGSKLEAQLESIGYLLKDNIDELRRNIFDLRPIDLEGKSLFGVLENFVAEFGRRWNLYTTCSVRGKAVEVPTEVESSLYRILQETLSNARRHANCTRISVKLEVVDNQLITLEIKDDGRGFDITQPHQNSRTRKSNGLGLISMRERAESVNGRLIIESAPGQGTRVFASLPLRPDPVSAPFHKGGKEL